MPVDLYDQIIVPYIREAGYNWYCTLQNTKTEAIEVSGPWKREAGVYEIEVKSILVLHGFDAFQNKNEALAGIENIYGWDLSKGMSVGRDSYSHDPNGWYCHLRNNVQRMRRRECARADTAPTAAVTAAPERYQGHMMKVTGLIEREMKGADIAYYCSVYDETQCCSVKLELLLREDSKPPKLNADMTPIGLFKTYKDTGAIYCQLVDAAWRG